MFLTDPSRVWFASTKLHAKGRKRLARLLKLYNYLVFKAVLAPEANLLEPVILGHYGLGIVVHPNVTFGRNVRIWHSVTLSVTDSPGTKTRLEVGDNVEFGAGSVVVTRYKESCSICSDVRIGANSVVTRDILHPGSYAGSPVKKLPHK